MKELSTLVGLAFFALLIVGCEGPQGATGAAGADGTDGTDGTNGINAAETCTDCHVDDVELWVRQAQYANSLHGTGETVERGGAAYDNTDNSCAKCHSHDGFALFVEDGTTVSSGFDNPARINCRSCHMIHTSYTQADWGLSINTPVTLDFDGSTADFGSVANLCVNCHQARAVSPMPVVDGAAVTLSSSRYGTHHGPQTQVVGGTGLFEFGNITVTGGPNTHGNTTSNAAVCAGCHMYEPAWGDEAGGHTWSMEYDYHGTTEDFIQPCNQSGCHSSVADFDYAGVHTCVENALLDLATYLENTPAAAPNGIKRTTGMYINAGTYSANLAAAFLNLQNIEEDRSHGVHNPAYAKQVLEDTFTEFSIATPTGCW
jgi:hypothetical protein